MPDLAVLAKGEGSVQAKTALRNGQPRAKVKAKGGDEMRSALLPHPSTQPYCGDPDRPRPSLNLNQ
jgi:hypothetical protein